MTESDPLQPVLTDATTNDEALSGTRLVVTLSPPAARRARQLAEHLQVRVPEVIRRGLALVSLATSLSDGEYLAVRRANGELERVLLVTD